VSGARRSAIEGPRVENKQQVALESEEMQGEDRASSIAGRYREIYVDLHAYVSIDVDMYMYMYMYMYMFMFMYMYRSVYMHMCTSSCIYGCSQVIQIYIFPAGLGRQVVQICRLPVQWFIQSFPTSGRSQVIQIYTFPTRGCSPGHTNLYMPGEWLQPLS